MSIAKVIEQLVRDSEKNRLDMIDGTPIFDSPLVGFADGNDPLFVEYKHIIGDFHFTPQEILKKHFPTWDQQEDSCSVISWVLPLKEATRRSNARQQKYPSERWAHSKLFGEQFNSYVRSTVVDSLLKDGFLAVAPVLSPCYGTRYSPDIASSWSERHVAYVAGLGTFGLSDGFITSKGIAIRCGSIVTNFKMEPTNRRYQNHLENCLFFNSGTCGLCIERCPVGAIDEKGHDKVKCREFCNITSGEYVSEHYGVDVSCCGLCQTGVPCESEIP